MTRPAIGSPQLASGLTVPVLPSRTFAIPTGSVLLSARKGLLMPTWKVWTDAREPVFEGDEEEARTYFVEYFANSKDAALESPDGDSWAYQDGVWVSLDTNAVWASDNAAQA